MEITLKIKKFINHTSLILSYKNQVRQKNPIENRKMTARTIISTIYEGYAVKKAITKLAPDRLILLVDEPKDKSKKERIINTVKSLKEFFQKTLEIKEVRIHSYDIISTMKEVIRIIDEESQQNNKVFIHTTEGRKTTSLALLFATYRKKEQVEGAYYITEEEHNLIRLPMLSFDVNDTKKLFLQKISEGVTSLKELQAKVKLKQSATYQNIQELKEEGYIKSEGGELQLTDLGKIMIF
jgi:CRISPR locus-related DNA-binding protein